MTIRGRNNYVISTPGFVVDHDSVSLNSGRQIDWDNVPVGYGVAGSKVIPAGTVVSADATSGLLSVRTGVVDGDDAAGILVTGASERSRSDSLSGYGVYVGGVFYANLLPDFEEADWATIVTELGTRFVFETYQDDR